MIDYVTITTGYRSLIYSCEVVRTFACGDHLGVRTALGPAPPLLQAKTFRRPKSLEAAVNHFSRIGLVRPGIAISTWEQAWAKTYKQARAHVLAVVSPKVTLMSKDYASGRRLWRPLFDMHSGPRWPSAAYQPRRASWSTTLRSETLSATWAEAAYPSSRKSCSATWHAHALH